MARLQDHDDKPATTLDWTTLLDEYERTVHDFTEFGEARDGWRVDEIRAAITDRVMRADLAYPGCMELLRGAAL